MELSETEFPSSVREREWLNWMPFYHGSNARLSPNGHCDCYREYARPVGSKSIENRYFWREVPGAYGSQAGHINVSFFNLLSLSIPLMGHWAPFSPLSDERHRNATHRRNWQRAHRLAQPA